MPILHKLNNNWVSTHRKIINVKTKYWEDNIVKTKQLTLADIVGSGCVGVVGIGNGAVQETAIQVAHTVFNDWIIYIEMDWVISLNTEEFLKRLNDEDDGDKSGEALLSETSDVLDQSAQVENDNEQDKTGSP